MLDRADDAFFFPLDLAEDLTHEGRPAWLDSAVATNRAEMVRLFDQEEPLDLLEGDASRVASRTERWEIAPLLPMV